MQAIGSVLLKPRKLQIAASATTDSALVDDALQLIIRVLVDKGMGGTAAETMAESFEATFEALLDQAGDGLEAAEQHLVEWLQPLIDRFKTLAGAFSAGEVLDGGVTTLNLLADLTEGLTPDGVRAILDRLLTVAEDDFGLTNAFLQNQVDALFDDMISRLSAMPAEPDEAVKQNRLAIIGCIRRLKRALTGQFTLPPLNVDQIAAPLIEWLRDSGFAGLMEKVACITRNVSGVGAVGAGLLAAVPYTGGGIGAAGGTPPPGMAYYPSWLLDKYVKHSELSAHPELTRFTYADSNLSQQTMEDVAFHSLWIMYALEGLLNITSIEQGDYGENIMQFLRCGVDLLVVVGAKDDLHWAIRWFAIALPILLLFGGLEGRSLGQFDALQYFMRVGSDAAQIYLYAYWTRMARNFLLSLLTLINHDGSEGDNAALNKEQILGFMWPFLDAATWMTAALVPHNCFSIQFQNANYGSVAGPLFGIWLGGGTGMFLLMYLVSFGLAAGVADRKIAKGGTLGKAFGLGWLSVLNFVFYWWLINDGNTGGGTRGFVPSTATPPDPRGDPVTFAGYPDKSTSPYKLPFEKGKSEECVQGNHGFFSHHSLSSLQDFAYDFSLSLGQNVVAMRGGTVVALEDGIADGTSGSGTISTVPGVAFGGTSANTVIIRHDTVNNDHDKSVNGAVVTTYARYLHGKNGTVVVTAGQVVNQGDILMQADHTGMSGFNHVHVDVVPDNGGSPGNFSLPFVFADVGGNGVPSSFNYYTSDNP